MKPSSSVFGADRVERFLVGLRGVCGEASR
jgi:hypothetical protein